LSKDGICKLMIVKFEGSFRRKSFINPAAIWQN